MKKRTKNVIKGILIPIAVILSLLIAVGGFYWTKLDKLQFSDGKVESGGTVDDSDDDVLEEESRMADAISGLKEQEVISASGDVNENKIWHCYCDCGNEIDVSYKALVYGNQQSCGCKKREHESELGTYLTHIDGTSIEALKSSKIPSNNTTGVRGVYCVKGRYKAKIVFQKKQFSLGTYDTLAEAATARKKAEKMLKSEVIAFYERWTAKAAANPAWAKENPIHFQVTKNGAEELELQLAPKLDPETH